jgi:hypothetical protein
MSEMFLDNPKAVEKWLIELDSKEQNLVNAGFTLALRSLISDMSDSKSKLCEKIMEINAAEDSDMEWKGQLLARMHTLDAIESHSLQRIDQLETPF